MEKAFRWTAITLCIFSALQFALFMHICFQFCIFTAQLAYKTRWNEFTYFPLNLFIFPFLCGSRVAQWEDEAANVFATRAITCAKCTKEQKWFNFLPTLSLIKAWHFFLARLNYSCAFYIFTSSPSTWYFVFCVGAPHTPNKHAFFIYIMLEVQHKKSQNICHVECAARAVIFQLSKHLFPREFLWFFYHSFHSRLMSDAYRINRTKKTKISSSGRKMRGKFIRERRLIKK